MPTHQHQYLIVGGGMAADAAVAGIRHVDGQGSIGLVARCSCTRRTTGRHCRKDFGRTARCRAFRARAGPGGDALPGRKVRSLDATRNCVTDDQGNVYRYRKLLLATGGTPRRLSADSDSILYYRTLDDYQALRSLTQERQRFAVVGGGFIGSEIAAALSMNGKQVVMIFPERGIGGRMFPPELAAFLTDFYRRKGVEVLAGQEVVEIDRRQNQLVLRTRSRQTGQEEEIVAEAAVAGLGIRPNVELARRPAWT